MRFFKSLVFPVAMILATQLIAPAAVADDELASADLTEDHELLTRRIGTAYIVDKDNGYLTRIATFNLRLARFTPRPKIECGTDCPDALAFPEPREFVVEAVVAPDVESRVAAITCRANSIFCYYRVRFSDGKAAYVSAFNFEASARHLTAVTMDIPGLFSIRPKVPTAQSRKDQAALKSHFRKIGIKPGFTMAEVLRSNWGKPNQKMPAGGRSEIWLYDTERYCSSMASSRRSNLQSNPCPVRGWS